MKGTAIRAVNLKMTTGAGSTLFTLPVGGYVFGTKGATDLTGFDHYYLPNGTKKMLTSVCKATLSCLELSDVEEGGVIIPDPIPDPTPVEDLNILVNISGSIVTVVVDGVSFARSQ